MSITDYQNIIALATTITILGTAWLTIRKIAKDAEKAKKIQRAEILQSAKEEVAITKALLDAKIAALKVEITTFEDSINREISFMKESHSNEIKTLGDKIDNLRDDLRSQHANLLTLITKLIENQ